jgi:hypothetical protein
MTIAESQQVRLAVFGVSDHRAELEQCEQLAAPTNTSLPEDHRSAVLRLHDRSDDQHDRSGQNQTDGGQHDVADALHRAVPTGETGLAHANQWRSSEWAKPALPLPTSHDATDQSPIG